ncbi:hypothetical protein [Qipengyuania sp. ASV99]|uniref:hypothetical protein n=1 Tax=Qipengyuania sp. ASV99 TaxID=3399681 RepID=UPI003A4C7DBD
MILFFIVRKFFKIRMQLQIQEAIKQHVWFAYRMLKPFDTEINPRIWKDRYFLGYIQGYEAFLIKFSAPNLSPVEKGSIGVRAMQELVPDNFSDVLELVSDLYVSKSPAFMRGMQHGGDVAILMSDKAGPELLADADVQSVLREAPSASELSSTLGMDAPVGQTATAGGLLMQLHLSRHREQIDW